MNIAHSVNDCKTLQADVANLADMADELQQFVETAAQQGDDFHGIEKGVLAFVLGMRGLG